MIVPSSAIAVPPLPHAVRWLNTLSHTVPVHLIAHGSAFSFQLIYCLVMLQNGGSQFIVAVFPARSHRT